MRGSRILIPVLIVAALSIATVACNLNPTVTTQLALTQGALTISDGGRYDFGSFPVNTSHSAQFTLTNTGTTAVDVTNITSTVQSFSVGGFSPRIIQAGGSLSFTVNMTASTTAGSVNSLINIANNASDSSPDFTFTVAGTWTSS